MVRSGAQRYQHHLLFLRPRIGSESVADSVEPLSNDSYIERPHNTLLHFSQSASFPERNRDSVFEQGPVELHLQHLHIGPICSFSPMPAVRSVQFSDQSTYCENIYGMFSDSAYGSPCLKIESCGTDVTNFWSEVQLRIEFCVCVALGTVPAFRHNLARPTIVTVRRCALANIRSRPGWDYTRRQNNLKRRWPANF